MQERYLGDSHDFLKYALLRHLQATLGLRLGINWYLTKPEVVDLPGNSDGNKRHHLNQRGWRDLDPFLYDRLQRFDSSDSRTLPELKRSGIFAEDTRYFDDEVPSHGRGEWLAKAVESLGPADLVFVDPDNGFEVPSMTARTRPKYALFDDIAPFVRAGKSIVAIQFARQCDPIARAILIRDELESRFGGLARLPVVRGRVAPNILFFSIARAGSERAWTSALQALADTARASRVRVSDFSKIELID